MNEEREDRLMCTQCKKYPVRDSDPFCCNDCRAAYDRQERMEREFRDRLEPYMGEPIIQTLLALIEESRVGNVRWAKKARREYRITEKPYNGVYVLVESDSDHREPMKDKCHIEIGVWESFGDWWNEKLSCTTLKTVIPDRELCQLLANRLLEAITEGVAIYTLLDSKATINKHLTNGEKNMSDKCNNGEFNIKVQGWNWIKCFSKCMGVGFLFMVLAQLFMVLPLMIAVAPHTESSTGMVLTTIFWSWPFIAVATTISAIIASVKHKLPWISVRPTCE